MQLQDRRAPRVERAGGRGVGEGSRETGRQGVGRGSGKGGGVKGKERRGRTLMGADTLQDLLHILLG